MDTAIHYHRVKTILVNYYNIIHHHKNLPENNINQVPK